MPVHDSKHDDITSLSGLVSSPALRPEEVVEPSGWGGGLGGLGEFRLDNAYDDMMRAAIAIPNVRNPQHESKTLEIIDLTWMSLTL